MKSRYDRFSSLILSINKNIQKIKNYEMNSFGLKGKQVQCIYHLYNDVEGISATQLALLCNEDKGAMSRTIKELEMGDYLYVEEKGGQKYRNPIKLTARGRELGKLISNRIDDIFSIGSDGIDEDERENFYSLLNIVSDNLQKICQKYGGKNGD